MKKHLAVICFVFTMLLIPVLSYSETKFNVKVGHFSPSDDAMDTIYGSGISYGIDVTSWKDKWGLGLGVNRFEQDGDPVTLGPVYYASSEIKITSFTSTLLYRLDSPELNAHKKIYPYFGVGLGVYHIEEEVTSSIGSVSASGNVVGAHVLGGIDIPVSESTSLFVEANLSSASIDTAGLGENIGGFTLYGGIRF